MALCDVQVLKKDQSAVLRRMILERTHQIRQTLQLCERRLAVQPRHDWPELFSQSPENSFPAEDVERGHAQRSGCASRACSQNNPALIHQAKHRPLFGRNAGVGEGIEDGLVGGVLTRAPFQGQSSIIVNRIDPRKGLSVLWKQGFEKLWRNAHRETPEYREEPVDVEPYCEDSRAMLDVVDDVCVVPEVVVALAKGTLTDDVCGQICEQALELHRLLRHVRSLELLAQEVCGCLDHRPQSLK